MEHRRILFNNPYMTGKELFYIAKANFGHMLAGDGPFTVRCHKWLETTTGCSKALLSHSCTAALEMTALLMDIQPGDEVIMPSFTFVSTANAFVLRGAVPVFVDIRSDTLNINEKLIESAITKKTVAIVVVHYGGVSCEMDSFIDISQQYNLVLIEDAAQGVMASYKKKKLGTIGTFGTYSFHETKNVISGEGGALLINDSKYSGPAEIIREKGTDRSRFFRGEIDKYTWQEMGSSFLPGELIAAFLWAQLEDAELITKNRLEIWKRYHELCKPAESKGLFRRPIIPPECEHNGHMYYIILSPGINRQRVLDYLHKKDINALFHYVPLHSSPAGVRYGKTNGDLNTTVSLSSRLIRLPLWIGLSRKQQEKVVEVLEQACRMS